MESASLVRRDPLVRTGRRALRSLVVGIALTLFLGPGPARAQVSELERSRYGEAAYYNYAEEADVTVLVNVWGAVRNPGLYEVPRGMRLSRLLSITGGPLAGERRRSSMQELTLRLSRATEGGDVRAVVFEETMRDQVFVFEEDPTLQDGDVLTAERYMRDRFTWRDLIPIVGAAASVASTILSIRIITRDAGS